ncbi:hypothetical protein B296_00041333 [Ensete ventricosum]|uniref:Polygalacturonase n=1 Tax=Ensete ventricosum TaxID=4639 RepID=A0A426XGU4_ENSVE|nr:hypothetical protein B296_00041333 [Ensete ventricosum]
MLVSNNFHGGSTQKVVNVQYYGAKGDADSDSMVLTPPSSPSQITFGSCCARLELLRALHFALSFNSCKNLRVENLTVMDSPRMHISLEKCTGVDASHLSITAPDASPNTDGIHITHSKNVKIANSFIGTVFNVTVDMARFVGTTNGVRIKTWQDSAVQVMDVLYQNIRGTSASEVAINLQCSNDRPCRNVLLQDVNLVGIGGDSAKSLCSNVQMIKRGTVIPPPRVHD